MAYRKKTGSQANKTDKKPSPKEVAPDATTNANIERLKSK